MVAAIASYIYRYAVTGGILARAFFVLVMGTVYAVLEIAFAKSVFYASRRG